MRSAATVAVLFGLWLAPATADGAVVRIGGTLGRASVVFLADPTEANRLEVAEAGGELWLRDPGARLRAEAPCRGPTEHEVACPLPATYPFLLAELGDGDDAISIGSTPALTTLLPRFAGSPVPATVLRSGEGSDTIRGGSGRDELDGGLGTDRIDGGAGRDTLTYAIREGPVTVDLATGIGG